MQSLQSTMRGFKGDKGRAMARLVFWKDSLHLVCDHNSLSLSIHFWELPRKSIGWTGYREFQVCGEFSMKMHKAPGNRFNRCCQQGRRGKKSFSLDRFLWGPLLDLAYLAQLQHPDLIFRNSWDPEEEMVLVVCRLLWVIGSKKGKVACLIAF